MGYGKALLALLAVAGGIAVIVLVATGTIGGDGDDDSSSVSVSGGGGDEGPPGLGCDAPGARELDRVGQLTLEPPGGATGDGGEAPTGLASTICLDDELSLFVNTSNLPSRGQGEYVIWLYNSRRDALRLGGDTAVSGAPLVLGRVTVPQGVDPTRYRAIDISYESEEGASRHSGRSVLRARIPS